jgi:hypothetical protein
MVGTTAAIETSPTWVDLYPHTLCMCSGSAGSIAVSAILQIARRLGYVLQWARAQDK